MIGPLIVLVTGANKGIGREVTAQLAQLGHTVIIGSRDLERGTAAAEALRDTGGRVSAVQLDVTDAASVAKAAARVGAEHGRIDALVNNAGISGPPDSGRDAQRPSTADLTVIRSIFDTNVFGVITVTNAFLPLLRHSPTPRIVNVSSSSGSLAARSNPAIGQQVYAGLTPDELPIVAGYVPSKAALNALTLMYAAELRTDRILVNAVDPGFTATDLNNREPITRSYVSYSSAAATRGLVVGAWTMVHRTLSWRFSLSPSSARSLSPVAPTACYASQLTHYEIASALIVHRRLAHWAHGYAGELDHL